MPRFPVSSWKPIVKWIREHEFRLVFCLFVVLFCLIVWFCMKNRHLFGRGSQIVSSHTVSPEYMAILDKHREETLFPYRYLKDDQNRTLPIVLVSGFFRDERAQNMYQEYVDHGVKVAGITAYKTFPKRITDASEDRYHWTSGFDYTSRIQNWLCCMKNPEQYGFTENNRLADISESDFYNLDDQEAEKKYDVVYLCLNDQDTEEKPCPADGWNAINRNFELALECFPIMIQEYGLKILVVGRTKCGLEEKYGDRIETVDFLPYAEFQDKLRQSRMLFVPNIYDASPRVVAECIVKGLPVLMNRAIVCGSKYINYETGELFTDQNDIRGALDNLLGKMSKISPKKWWSENYGEKIAGTRMRDFLATCYPDIIGPDIQQVHF